MGKVFFISDTHFLHTNIVKYCNRPEDHNQLMFRNWNSVVTDNDYVFHLGDFSAGVGSVENGYEKLKKIAQNLNGKKILIRGNHDHYSNDKYIDDLGFESVHDYVKYENLFLCHYPLIIDEYTKEYSKIIIEELNKKFEASGAQYLVHGHSHLTKFEKKINVSADLIGFTPILKEDLFKLL